MATDPAIRASDADREHLADLLGEHLIAGRLNLDEFQERTDAAYAAVTLADLAPLLSDLPLSAPPTNRRHLPQPTRKPLRRSGEPLGGRWASWLLTGMICNVIWVATCLVAGRMQDFWPIWVIGPWGFVLLAHALGGRVQALDSFAHQIDPASHADPLTSSKSVPQDDRLPTRHRSRPLTVRAEPSRSTAL